MWREAAAARGDSYCSLAWGGTLAGAPDADADLAAAVLSGTNAGLTAQEVAMASWARRVVTDPQPVASLPTAIVSAVTWGSPPG